MGKIKIRKAVLTDAEIIAGIHVRSWQQSYCGIVARDYLDNLSYAERLQLRKKLLTENIQHSEYFVITNDDAIVGFCDVGENRDKTQEYRGEIYAIYLLDDYKGLGLGQKLFNTAVKYLKGKKLIPYVVWVLEANKVGCRFYEKNGGRIIQKKTIKIGEQHYLEVAYLFENFPAIESTIPSWPKERDLARYAEFTHIDFDADLAANQIWIDIGCRTGQALSETRRKYNAKLIGVNAHHINVLPGIHSIYAMIPSDQSVYMEYRNQANLVTDIHGAISYAEDPIATLIYEACLLKPHGKAVAVTMEDRIGYPTHKMWEKLQHFFKHVMGKHIIFEPFTSYSDNTKTPIKTIRITTINDNSTAEGELSSLLLQAKKYFGRMEKTVIVAQVPDGTAQIWQVAYK